MIGVGWLLYAAVYAAFARDRFSAGAGRRVPDLRAVFRADRRSGEGLGGRPRAGDGDAAMRSASTTPLIGFGALGASLLFGFIWTRVSPHAAFFTGAGFALAATGLLYLTFSSTSRPRASGRPGSEDPGPQV